MSVARLCANLDLALEKRKELKLMDKTYNYMPQPVDVSDVVLPEALNPFIEALAENVH